MATVRLTNLTNNNYSFEATVLVLQGQHQTLRAKVPAGGSTLLVLPANVTPEMLAEVPSVKAELKKASPSYRIEEVVDPSISSLGGGQRFTIVDNGAAGNIALMVLGIAEKASILSRLRVVSEGAAVALETLTFDQIEINGVAVSIPLNALQVAGPLAAFAKTDFDLRALLGVVEVPEGAMVKIAATYAGGPGMTNVQAELLLALVIFGEGR